MNDSTFSAKVSAPLPVSVGNILVDAGLMALNTAYGGLELTEELKRRTLRATDIMSTSMATVATALRLLTLQAIAARAGVRTEIGLPFQMGHSDVSNIYDPLEEAKDILGAEGLSGSPERLKSGSDYLLGIYTRIQAAVARAMPGCESPSLR